MDAFVPSTTEPRIEASCAIACDAKDERNSSTHDTTIRIRIDKLLALQGRLSRFNRLIHPIAADYSTMAEVAFGYDGATMRESASQLATLSAARWRLAVLLTSTMTVVYVGFILLVAYNKPLLATLLMPGLSLGILLGVLVIFLAWALILVYVRWTNRHYDDAVATIRRAHQEGR